LLVVLGIIALLISILLPALSRARATAMDLQCQTNLRSMAMGVMQYADDWSGVLPRADSNYPNDVSPFPPATGGYIDDWLKGIEPYLRKKAGTNVWQSEPLYLCPRYAGELVQQNASNHYGMNAYMDMGFTYSSSSAPGPKVAAPGTLLNYKITQINRPAEIVLFGDKNDTQWSPIVSQTSSYWVQLRHGNAAAASQAYANIVFADGHTGTMTSSERAKTRFFDFTVR